jgi:hypothetical protein
MATARKPRREKKTPAPAPAPASALIGTWGPEEEGDSNLHLTVTRRGRALAVAAVDAYDGEQLEVSGVVLQGKRLRFQTVTPSTGSRLEHELESTAGGGAVYRFTVTQRWQRLPGK